VVVVVVVVAKGLLNPQKSEEVVRGIHSLPRERF